MEHDEYTVPPGCKSAILAHPSGANEAIELALFHDHRYAFFFWSRWTRQLGLKGNPPALISLDWHEDLVHPDGTELDDLKGLQQVDLRELSIFCWESLSPLNDSHVLAAAYLNLVGDIYVVRKQLSSTEDSSFEFQDAEGRVHHVRCFDTVEELMVELQAAEVERVFFDIDLDYFTESEDSCGGGEDVELVSDEIVKNTLDPEGELLRWVFERFAGMTIATEPEFCGGIVNSNHLLSLISESLFDPQLMAEAGSWRHLRDE